MNFPGRHFRDAPWGEILRKIESGGDVTEPEKDFVEKRLPGSYEAALATRRMTMIFSNCKSLQKVLVTTRMDFTNAYRCL